MVRYATEHDLPRLLELAREEHALSPWHDMAFDLRAAEGTARSFLMTPGRTLLCTEGGYLAGMVQAMGFAPRRVALEYAWFAKDGTGLRLLRAFERWAANMGASAVVVHDYAAGGRLSRTLQPRGWDALGRAITKRLES